jgi:hypothetical protein
MKLCYRGVKYDYSPPSIEVRESELTGRYRGRDIHFSYVSHIPVPQPVATLTYRGVGYTTTTQGQVVSPIPQAEQRQSVFQGIKTVDHPVLKARRHLLIEAADAHRISIQRSLDHRLSVAKAQGNDRLVRQLEEELHQLV